MARQRRGSAPPPGRPAELPDPCTAYARAVVAGAIPAGGAVRQACERHLRDLVDGAARGIVWQPERAWRACVFFSTLRFTKGRWAQQYFELQPWQAFIVGSLFGWRRAATGTRRFRTAFVEVPRKNGKTELAGGIALLVTFFDDPIEYGAEGYTLATKQSQARICFAVAKQMMSRSPAYGAAIRRLAHRLVSVDTGSYLEPLGADARTLDGLNPHCGVIDELHAHPTSAVVDIMESALGARAQPLLFEITTSPQDEHGICAQHHNYSLRVLDPAAAFDDDSWFAYVAAPDAGDAWDQETTWKKANPNYGVTVTREYFEERARRAKELPSALVEFKLKNLDVRTSSTGKAVELATWDRGADPIDLEALKGRRCFGGLDLAIKHDTSALVLVFPPTADDPKWVVVPRFYVPESDIQERSRRDRVPYDQWARTGLLVATPGDVTDFDFIEEDVKAIGKLYDLRELAYDEHQASQLANHLTQTKFTLVPFGQGWKSMAMPTQYFQRLLHAGDLRHGGHPVLRWQASNLVVRRGAAGDTKPDKERSRERIDGIVALVMALGRAVLAPAPTKPGKVRVL